MSFIQRYWSALGPKRFVFVLSTMRSGSTLLKSLLAVPDETSHLPEIHFHKYQWLSSFRLKALSEKPIIVLKKPSWVGEENYPSLPSVKNKQSIVLIRHPYETIRSMEKMKQELTTGKDLNWNRAKLLDYWCETYENLNKLRGEEGVYFVRYETLTSQPVNITASIFDFLRITHAGIDTYKKPVRYQWSWMNDDGGDKIKSLKVSPSKVIREDEELISLIEGHPKANIILSSYGYTKNDAS